METETLKIEVPADSVGSLCIHNGVLNSVSGEGWIWPSSLSQDLSRGWTLTTEPYPRALHLPTLLHRGLSLTTKSWSKPNHSKDIIAVLRSWGSSVEGYVKTDFSEEVISEPLLKNKLRVTRVKRMERTPEERCQWDVNIDSWPGWIWKHLGGAPLWKCFLFKNEIYFICVCVYVQACTRLSIHVECMFPRRPEV